MDLMNISNSTLPEQYQTMLKEVSDFFPVINRASQAFFKTQSQYMDNVLTLSLPTELRNARQVLAEINKSRMALEEAAFGIARKRVKIDQLKNKLRNETNEYEKRLIEIDIAEAEFQINNSVGYIQGAIRKIHNYMAQYKRILENAGKEFLTEEDFERDEARYHVMRAFEQALCAARSRGGVIDEGNHIYLHQIGINGAMAQAEVSAFLSAEQELISNNKAPTHEMQISWLKNLGEKYAKHSESYAISRGIELVNKESFHWT